MSTRSLQFIVSRLQLVSFFPNRGNFCKLIVPTPPRPAASLAYAMYSPSTAFRHFVKEFPLTSTMRLPFISLFPLPLSIRTTNISLLDTFLKIFEINSFQSEACKGEPQSSHHKSLQKPAVVLINRSLILSGSMSQ